MLIALASAKGAPGVTTTARVLASVWPREVVLVDADPAGGDISLLARAQDGNPLDPERGILSFAADARRGLTDRPVDDHLQRVVGGLDVMCGVGTPEQINGVAPALPQLGDTLARLTDRDVVVDLGRLDPSSPALPLAAAAHVLVLVVRPQLEAYAHLRNRLRWLGQARDQRARVPQTGILLVADSRDRHSARDLGQLLAHEQLAARVIGQVAHDPRAADVIAGRLERPVARSLLVRTVREVVDPVRALVSTDSRTPVRNHA